ncbi:Tripartite motif containing 37 [Basidiobolus ranarum]
MLYYCKTCNEALCSDCAMFGGKHRDHEFERLQTIYEHHVNNLRQQSKELRQRLVKFEEMIKNVELRERLCRDAKSQAEQELLSLTRYYQNLLFTQLQQKQTTLFVQKAVLTKDKDCLVTALNEIDDAVSNCSWVELIQEQAKIVDFLKKIQNSIPEQLKHTRVSTLFQRDFAPTYDYDIVEIKNISQLAESSAVYYSRPLKSSGVSWRLKVYTIKDDGEVYLSMFLELLMGSSKPSAYQYSLSLKHPLNLGGFERKFSSDFRLGDCWGYNKFCKISFLKERGFISSKDVLRVRYMVRASTYYQKCLDQKRYIKKLEKTLSNRTSLVQSSKDTSYPRNESRSSSNPLSHPTAPFTDKLCTACKQPFVGKYDVALEKWTFPNSIQISEKLYHLDCRKASMNSEANEPLATSTTKHVSKFNHQEPNLDKGKSSISFSRYESLPLSIDDADEDLAPSTSRLDTCHYDIDTESQRPSSDPSFRPQDSSEGLYKMETGSNFDLEEIPDGIPLDEGLLESLESFDIDSLSLNDLYDNRDNTERNELISDFTDNFPAEFNLNIDSNNISLNPSPSDTGDLSQALASRGSLNLSFSEDSLRTQSDVTSYREEYTPDRPSHPAVALARSSTPRRERAISMPNSLGGISESLLRNTSSTDEARAHRLSASPIISSSMNTSHSDEVNRNSLFLENSGPSASDLFKRYLVNKQRQSEETPTLSPVSPSSTWPSLSYFPQDESEAGPSSPLASQRRDILRMLENDTEETTLEESSNQLQLRLDESFDILEKIKALTRSLDEAQEAPTPVESPSFDVAPWNLESYWSDREN